VNQFLDYRILIVTVFVFVGGCGSQQRYYATNMLEERDVDVTEYVESGEWKVCVWPITGVVAKLIRLDPPMISDEVRSKVVARVLSLIKVPSRQPLRSDVGHEHYLYSFFFMNELVHNYRIYFDGVPLYFLTNDDGTRLEEGPRNYDWIDGECHMLP